MVWILKSGRTEISIQGRTVLGRADFPSEPLLSRQHFEIYFDRQHIFARDLGSSNGTIANGKKLEPHQAIELQDGSKLRIGKREFTLRKRQTHLTFAADLFIFLGLGLFMLCDPSLSLGRSVGAGGAIALIGSLLLAVLSSSLLWRLIFRKHYWSAKRYILYAASATLCALAFQQILAVYADRNFALGNDLVEAKIRYFCIQKFTQPECVRHVNLCPECALRIDKWQRNQILEKLKSFRGQYPKDALAESLRARPAPTRLPSGT